MDWPSCPPTFAPIVGGRFYINISAFRRLADLTPGTSPEDIDRALFAAGGVGVFSVLGRRLFSCAAGRRRHEGSSSLPIL